MSSDKDKKQELIDFLRKHNPELFPEHPKRLVAGDDGVIRFAEEGDDGKPGG